MTDLKTPRSPILPIIPTKEEWDKFSRIEQWRRSQLTIIRDLHATVYDDLSNISNQALDTFGEPSNSENLNTNSSRHGLCPRLSGLSNQYLSGAGTWTVPPTNHSPVNVVDSSSVNLTINYQSANQRLYAEVLGVLGEKDQANYSAGSNYTASTDGIVTFLGWECNAVSIKTPSNSILPSVGMATEGGNNATYLSVSIPVRKNSSWRADITPSNAVNLVTWTPIGS